VPVIRRAAILAALAVSGCGGDELPQSVARAVSGCGLPKGSAEASDPAARLVPGMARLVESRRTGKGHRAVAVIADAPAAAVRRFVTHARADGYALRSTEDEGFEADAILSRGRQWAIVKAYAGSCADASRAIVIVIPAA
jgi:hypothetical protein